MGYQLGRHSSAPKVPAAGFPVGASMGWAGLGWAGLPPPVPPLPAPCRGTSWKPRDPS